MALYFFVFQNVFYRIFFTEENAGVAQDSLLYYQIDRRDIK